MVRTLISLISLGVVGGWIALNYLPVDLASTNGFLQGNGAAGFAQVILVAGAGIFLMLQLMLLDSSVRLGELMNEHKSTHAINVNVVTEVMWTALPLLSTIAVIIVCYLVLTV
jgi:heme/copper-type cytochrome/quinol oxidase subunit 2